MNAGRIGRGLLSVLCVMSILGIGIAKADASVVTASITGTYVPGSCVLQTQSPTVDLSSGTGAINVYNNGGADSLGTPSTMTVKIAYQDYFNNVGYAENNNAYGWYNPGVAWVSGIYTNWYSTEYSGSWTTVTGTNQTAGTVYDNLASGTGTWSPINLQVLGVPAKLPSGTTYNQMLVLTGSC